MTEEEKKQKVYKIKQIEKYEELKESEQKVVDNTFLLTWASLVSGVLILINAPGHKFVQSLVIVLLGILELGIIHSAVFYGFIRAFVKKTVLESQIEELYHELGFDALNEEDREKQLEKLYRKLGITTEDVDERKQQLEKLYNEYWGHDEEETEEQEEEKTSRGVK